MRKKKEKPRLISSTAGFVFRFGREFGVIWECWTIGHRINVIGEFVREEGKKYPKLEDVPDMVKMEICHSIIQREIELIGKSYFNYYKREGKKEVMPKFEIFENVYKPCPRQLRDMMLKAEAMN